MHEPDLEMTMLAPLEEKENDLNVHRKMVIIARRLKFKHFDLIRIEN